MTIFSLTDFVVCADSLYEVNDLTANQYITLLNAIFARKPEVLALQSLYHNPDFILACDSEDVRESLYLRDLLHLGQRLEPLMLGSIESQGDGLLKWSIKTGLHNFSASMSSELPQEFVNIIYHMFSSGDEMILSACQKMAASDDSQYVEAALAREWDIYCRNKSLRDSVGVTGGEPLSSSSLVESTMIKASDNEDDSVESKSAFPECLLTAVACLTDQGELTEDAAAGILASYARGNSLIHDIYDHYVEFGGVAGKLAAWLWYFFFEINCVSFDLPLEPLHFKTFFRW